MKKTSAGILMLCIVATSVAIMQASAQSIPVSVDCNKGQSLNRILSELDKRVATTVSVTGTCTEYVQVNGFQNLTLKGLPGAVLVQPSTSPGNLFNAVLMIESSQSVTVDSLSIQANSNAEAIGIDHGSSDIRLRYLTVTGGGDGILIAERSQVSLAYVTGKDAGYAPLAIYDVSDVHVEHCAFENSSGQPWHAGIDLGASHLTIYDTKITNMQVGINAGAGSDVDVTDFSTYYPYSASPEVTISGSAGTNYNGVSLSGKSSLNVTAINQQSTKLVINEPGQSYGGTTGGVLVSDGSVLEANSNLVITGSHGQGVVVMNNSHATLSGASITGSGHGGLAVSNLSSIDVGTAATSTLVSGNGTDIFCDSDSTITGSTNLSGVASIKCTNLLPAEFTLP